MSDGRKRLSVSQYRKLSKQKLLEKKKDVRKNAKIDVLFKKQIQPVCSSLNLDRSNVVKRKKM